MGHGSGMQRYVLILTVFSNISIGCVCIRAGHCEGGLVGYHECKMVKND